VHRLRARADELEARRAAYLGEVRVLAEKPVARVRRAMVPRTRPSSGQR
jgi:hypothetical protein